jgi:DNA-binding CsgD family transcriptional regulator
MGEPSRPSWRQLRELYLLVGECCELGADPLAWRERMTEGLLRLLDAQVVLYTETEQVAPFGEERFLVPRLLVDCGWPCQSDRDALLEFMRTGNPSMQGGWCVREYIHARRPVLGVHRRRYVDEPAWYRGRFFNEAVRCSHVDHALMAQYRIGNELEWFTVFRGLSEPDFNQRQIRLLRLFVREYVRLFGTRLALRGEPSVRELPPRVRQVLVCLMEGDSEKQAALRLGISPHTVHDYVKQLHHRFGVSSRGELLSRCRKFWPVLTAEVEENAPSQLLWFSSVRSPPQS